MNEKNRPQGTVFYSYYLSQYQADQFMRSMRTCSANHFHYFATDTGKAETTVVI